MSKEKPTPVRKEEVGLRDSTKVSWEWATPAGNRRLRLLEARQLSFEQKVQWHPHLAQRPLRPEEKSWD